MWHGQSDAGGRIKSQHPIWSTFWTTLHTGCVIDWRWGGASSGYVHIQYHFQHSLTFSNTNTGTPDSSPRISPRSRMFKNHYKIELKSGASTDRVGDISLWLSLHRDEWYVILIYFPSLTVSYSLTLESYRYRIRGEQDHVGTSHVWRVTMCCTSEWEIEIRFVEDNAMDNDLSSMRLYVWSSAEARKFLFMFQVLRHKNIPLIAPIPQENHSKIEKFHIMFQLRHKNITLVAHSCRKNHKIQRISHFHVSITSQEYQAYRSLIPKKITRNPENFTLSCFSYVTRMRHAYRSLASARKSLENYARI